MIRKTSDCLLRRKVLCATEAAFLRKNQPLGTRLQLTAKSVKQGCESS